MCSCFRRVSYLFEIMMKSTAIIVLLSALIGISISKELKCGDSSDHLSGSFHTNVTEPRSNCMFNVKVADKGNATLQHIFLFFNHVVLDDEDEVFVNETSTSELTKLFTGNQDGFSYISNSLNISIIVKYSSAKKSDRILEVIFNSMNCVYQLQKESGVLKPPVVHKNISIIECLYTMIGDDTSLPYLSFSTEFNIGKGNLEIRDGSSKGSPLIESFTGSPKQLNDVMSTGHSMTVFTHLNFNESQTPTFEGHFVAVTYGCSSVFKEAASYVFQSLNFPHNYPAERLDCRSIFYSQPGQKLYLKFEDFSLADDYDIVDIRDGNRIDSSNLASFTNKTYSPTRYIYSTGESLWLRFTSDGEKSAKGFNGRVYSKKIGGYFTKSGNITLPVSVGSTIETYVYMLQTATDTQVQLTLNTGSDKLFPNSQLWIYHGFDRKSSALLDNLVSNRQFYDVISPSNQMMILAKKFGSPNTFSASFKGIPYGFHNISIGDVGIKSVDSMYLGNLSWIIRPHLMKGDNRLISLAIDDLVLNGNDTIKVCKLNNCVSPIVIFNTKNLYMATIYVNILSGIKIEIQRSYKYSSIITVFTASYRIIPACERKFNLTKGNPIAVESQNFPDDYPLYTPGCKWTFNVPPQSKIHFTFYHFDILSKHFLNFATTDNSSITKLSGANLPDDLIFNGTQQVMVTLQTPIRGQANSASGFRFVATLIECGGEENNSTGILHTKAYPKRVNVPMLCIWKVTVPWIGKQGNDSHQYISFSTNLNPSKTYSIYDGGSIKNAKVANVTALKGGQSLRNMIMVVYNKTTKKSEPGITLKYQASSCPKSRQCGDGICIHDSWVCDGIGQCSDFADEKNCTPKPSQSTPRSGVAVSIVVVCVLVFFFLGAVLAIIIPMFYRKYKTGTMYSSFSNIPVVTD